MKNLNLIDKCRLIPVVVINKIEDTIPTLKALCDGGLPIAEITYRTECAKDAITLAVKEFPKMLIGAGTVINGKQAEEAIGLGVSFIVSPGFSEDVAQVCLENEMAYFPGCVTPTEIMLALSYGYKVIKFFPASVYGGLKAMKALAAPFPQVKFIPTGGVDENNLAEYLAWEKVKAVGGSFMMKGDIKEKTENAMEIVNGNK
ncbi:MAG: bifunctional 4-hydroxy-2-oxoglutarate aldolase/2-dehydro-3-deoxy-phosphogluconate aldolase [Clostridia bacterium]